MNSEIHPVFLLLVHSCVASTLLFYILRYQAENGNSSEKSEDPCDWKTLVTAGFPLFIFNIAWVLAIFAVVSPYFTLLSPFFDTFADLCAFSTLLAILTTIFILQFGEFFGLSIIEIRFPRRMRKRK